MPRFTDADSDEERLPEGFTRIGYDADTQVYTFRDSSGALYESLPGNRYGTLYPAGEAPSHDEADLEAHDTLLPGMGERKRKWYQWRPWSEDMRMMLPFALLMCVFLLLVFRFVSGSGSSMPDDRPKVLCGPDSTLFTIHKGDTCWGIAEEHGITLEELVGMQGNEGVDCDRLKVGGEICVPA